jgi:hypothetical protein
MGPHIRDGSVENEEDAYKNIEGYNPSIKMRIAKELAALLAFVVFSLPTLLFAQNQTVNVQPEKVQPVKVKGGHELGETAQQFFAEGREKEMLSACMSGDFKSLNKSSRRQLRQFCSEFADESRQAMSGKRFEYKSPGDPSELRADTFTFDGARLVKVELVYTAPSAESNYRGQRFEEILAGVTQAYGPPTTEKTAPVKDTYGVEYVAHHEMWLTPQAAILIDETPIPGGSTTLLAFTRAEYDRTMSGAAKSANPLQ